MPNRIIKESICRSDSIDSLSWFEEVLFYRLIVSCDDYGRFDGRPAIIKNVLFPLKETLTIKAVSAALNKLASNGLVALYEFEGKPYLYLPTWKEHQTPRATKSKYPDPVNGTTLDSNLQAIECNCKQLNANAPDNRIRIRDTIHDNRDASKSRFAPPTLEEVEEYCKERNSSVDPKQFFEYFEAGGWKDSKGNSVKNWKQKLLTWEKFDTPHNAKNTSYTAEPTRSAAEDDKAMKALLKKLSAAE